MSKVWIGYVSCGAGHKKASEAIYQVFEDKKQVFLFNLLNFTNFFIRFFYEQGYRLAVGRIPLLWALLYEISSLKFFCRIILFFHYLIFRRFIKDVIRTNPEVLITTHFFISQIISLLKERFKIRTKLITVITDFGVHPLWVNKNTSYYIVASEDTKIELRKKFSVSVDKIKVWGLPLRRQFFIKDVSALERKYKKPKNIFTILLFSSEFGLGPLEKIIKEFYKKCGIFVIYGKNRKVKELIETIEKPLYLLGFDYKEEISELMELSDLVITKAGGLSVFECIAKKKPMVFMYFFYGQEIFNIRFVLKKGLGFLPKRMQGLISTINRIRENPKMLEQINKNFDRIKVEDASLKIKELVLTLKVVSNKT